MEEDRPPERAPGAEPWQGTTRELASALRALVTRLRIEQHQRLPVGDASLESPSPLKRRLKSMIFRSTRPATRRYDRLTADLATVAADLASRLAEAEEQTRKARGDYERLELTLRELAPAGTAATGSAVWTEIPDAYYWAFEQRMRGTSSSVEDRLQGYEDHVVRLRRSLESGDADPPRWIDLGCGQGEFCSLLREWGWRAEGVDASPRAAEACRERGIDVTLADVLAYLETRPDDDPVGGVSAIQLIEHLPRRAWVHLFEEIHRALGPGGAFLLETINGQNPEAVADYFVADVTHTWPGHPETLRVMAEHAGFDDVQVFFLHEDHRGRAQDVAIWAAKAGT
ncbi:MAG TPA: class I SAM-dependent methyltransferase [Actinomycetota bacterium]|nr:class I SAM-dependent methyltransferase [Actinomycetota bacterium]